MTQLDHVCGLFYLVPAPNQHHQPKREYLPQLSVSAHTKIVSSTSRTSLTQAFVNPKSDAIPELRYTFPLYEGVSVVGFVCTINDDRVIRGVIKERAEARTIYQEAKDRGKTAGLLEQLPISSDVFTTTVSNVPAGATLKVELTYLGELKHDAEVDGIRFTIPTHIAPRYGSYPGELLKSGAVDASGGISVVVDVEMPDGCNIKEVQSLSHPISVTVGNTSTGSAAGAEMSLQKASATLALATAELGADFILQVVATNAGNPVAVLETHPTIPNQRALMATLVPRFALPSSRPEIVFLCDRSGSMSDKIANLKAALRIFLKSLPVGAKFNICSFGSHHEFLFPGGSQTYDASTLDRAISYVDKFTASFGGTEIYEPMESIFEKRYPDMNLEVFLLTDGEVWDQDRIFELVNRHVADSKGAIRVFTLGIGRDVSHALVQGVAAAGNGFSQTVGDNENMNSKVVRMLKASLTPHITDYTLEVKYHSDGAAGSDDDFEMVDKIADEMTVDVREPKPQETSDPGKQQPISLFDESVNPDVEVTDPSLDTSAGGKYSHVPRVAEPKILQTPFIIPPLFPFNRTSVYLLLSPETAHKQPRAVVLRGTSAYGPVQLEIPVTVLAEKGETIHQLAARKAVRELEDGRGWIYHAREAAGSGPGNGGAGALLKDKFVGRFPDMVEREAVRLGVTFQVGGKWCSFVAVEGDREVVPEPARPQAQLHPELALLPERVSARSLFSDLKFRSTPLSGASPFDLSASIPLYHFGVSQGSFSVSRGPAHRIPQSAMDDNLETYVKMEETEPSVDKLGELVELQSFAGAWPWSDRLAGLLWLDRDATLAWAASAQLGWASDALATVLALACLESHFADRRDEWELLAEKAREWLRRELQGARGGALAIESYVEEAKKLVRIDADDVDL